MSPIKLCEGWNDAFLNLIINLCSALCGPVNDSCHWDVRIKTGRHISAANDRFEILSAWLVRSKGLPTDKTIHLKKEIFLLEYKLKSIIQFRRYRHASRRNGGCRTEWTYEINYEVWMRASRSIRDKGGDYGEIVG